jgi:uncharacterized protein (DUF2461 family)
MDNNHLIVIKMNVGIPILQDQDHHQEIEWIIEDNKIMKDGIQDIIQVTIDQVIDLMSNVEDQTQVTSQVKNHSMVNTNLEVIQIEEEVNKWKEADRNSTNQVAEIIKAVEEQDQEATEMIIETDEKNQITVLSDFLKE